MIRPTKLRRLLRKTLFCVAYLYLLGLVPYLHGNSVRATTVVLAVVEPGAGNVACTHFVRLRVDNQNAKVCVEQRFTAQRRPDLALLREGDRVDLVLKHT